MLLIMIINISKYVLQLSAAVRRNILPGVFPNISMMKHQIQQLKQPFLEKQFIECFPGLKCMKCLEKHVMDLRISLAALLNSERALELALHERTEVSGGRQIRLRSAEIIEVEDKTV